MNPRVQQPTVREVQQQVPPELASVFNVDPAAIGWHFWIEAPVGDAWVVAYRLQIRDQRPLIVEMRMFPAEGKLGTYAAPPGQWSGTWLADVAVPGNGITAAMLRQQVQPAIAVHMLKELRAELDKHAIDYWASRGAKIERTPSTRGRKPRADLFFAEIARDYVSALEKGSKQPAAELAKTRGLNRSTTRALVKQARAKGFLDVAPNGLAGGALTDAARRVLKSAKTRKRR